MSGYTTIEHDLRSVLEGECSFDELTRLEYSTAACWYKIKPVGVVFPGNPEDVQKTARYCFQNGIPLIARGAGTGLAGQAVGMGIVVDFTRHMNTVLAVNPETVDIQPGLVLNELNKSLLPHRRLFPVDPASGSLCSVGGMIATNASGGHGVKYGSTKDHVERLSVVLSNGETATIGSPASGSTHGQFPTLDEVRANMEPLLRKNKELILRRFPHVAKNSCGYNLLDAVKTEPVDLRKIIVGSEGTLALVVGATLRTTEIPSCRIGALAYFRNYETTAEATLKGLQFKPAAVELLDHTYFTMAKGKDDGLLLDEAAAILYFEFEGTSVEELAGHVDRLKAELAACHILDFRVLRTDEDRKKLWNLREEVSRMMNFDKTFGKTSFVEDVAVPVLNLPAFIDGLRSILDRYNIRFSIYGHAGTGNIHCGTFVDLRNLDHYKNIDTIASDVSILAISLGGTLSGEHGDGFIRTPFLERLYGAELYEVFKQVKGIFDPTAILNPGKIVGPQNASILHDIDFA
ncbi:MAG: FAD-binding oxidoreductase [Bacteroidota bacterium]